MDFTREYVRTQFAGTTEANLALLSDRYVVAAGELGLRSTPLLFNLKHGTISAMHYRALAEVLAVIMCDSADDHPELMDAITTTTQWYWAVRAPEFSETMLAELHQLGFEMRASWKVFEDLGAALHRDGSTAPRGPLDNLPKMHRAVSHLAEFIRGNGPFSELTTEASETANKALKGCFRTYVYCLWIMSYLT